MYTRITRHTGEPDARLAIVATLVGLFAALAVAGTARAAENGVVVRYHSTELQNGRLAGDLYARLETAAERSCTTPGRRSLARMAAERACVGEALDRAVQTIDSPVLSAIHAAKDSGTQLARR
jgi:UrcA family protein